MCIPFRFAIKEHSSTSVGWKSLKPCVPCSSTVCERVCVGVWQFNALRVCMWTFMYACVHARVRAEGVEFARTRFYFSNASN